MTAPTMTPDSDEQAPSSSSRRSSPPVTESIRSTVRSIPGRVRQIRPSSLGRSPWLTGIVGALWAAGIGLAAAALSMVLVWIATPDSGLSLADFLRIGGLLWAVAQGTPIAIGVVTYSLVPWGLALVPILLLGYAGGWSARRAAVSTVRQFVLLTGCAVATYSVLAALVANLSTRPDASVSTAAVALHAAVLSAVAFGWGAWRASRETLASAAPWWIPITVRGGVMGTLSVLGFGAIAGAAALLVRVDDAITMTQSLHAGFWGGLALLLLGLAYVPVAIVWSTAYVVGAGFAIGPAVIVSPFIPVTAPTQLPPFPMLASVPQSATPAAWVLPVLGVVSGVIVGLAIARSCRDESRLTRLVLAFGSAAVTGVLMLVAAYLAGGALGDVRLAHLGPSASTVGVLVFVLVLLGAVPSAVAPSPPVRPTLAVAEPAGPEDPEDVTHAEADVEVDAEPHADPMPVDLSRDDDTRTDLPVVPTNPGQ